MVSHFSNAIIVELVNLFLIGVFYYLANFDFETRANQVRPTECEEILEEQCCINKDLDLIKLPPN